jgi:hypothetical protein
MTVRVRRMIAAYELIGGLSGLLTGAPFLVRALSSGGIAAFVAFVILTACVSSVAAGWLLWQGRGSGRGLSLVVQWLSLPRLSSPLASYLLFVGLDLTVGLQHWLVDLPGLPPGARGTEVMFAINYSAGFSFSVLQPTPSLAIGVNLAALAALVPLLRARPLAPSGSGAD